MSSSNDLVNAPGKGCVKKRIKKEKQTTELELTLVDLEAGRRVGGWWGGLICRMMNCRTACPNLPQGPGSEINKSGRPAMPFPGQPPTVAAPRGKGGWRRLPCLNGGEILGGLFVWGRGVKSAQVHQIN